MASFRNPSDGLFRFALYYADVDLNRAFTWKQAFNPFEIVGTLREKTLNEQKLH
jgi:hypothetical protein